MARLVPVLLVLLLLLADSLAFAGEANVFVYHRFNDSRYPSTNISNKDFRAHLEMLRDNEFSVLTLGEIIAKIKAGEKLPSRCAAISVDYAYRSFQTDGWPLLKEFDFPATLFVSTDSVGQGSYLGWNALKALAAEGVEIGNHSAAHAYLLDHADQGNWEEWVREDLARSKKAFTEHLGYSPELFAYPYGEYSPELIKIIREAGFTAAFAQQSGVIASGLDLFSLPRFPMGAGFVTLDSFRSKLFMKSLAVDVVLPESPVINEENPPQLKFHMKDVGQSFSPLNCFIPGQKACEVKLLDEAAGLYGIIADSPLQGRRSKYTITTSDRSGRTWFWFSQLWVMPHTGPMADNPVSRLE